MDLDVVIPFYNEARCAPVFLGQLLDAFAEEPRVTIRLLLVDDGSADETFAVLKRFAEADRRIAVIGLSGNHGHQKALVAGMDNCDADAVLMMDGDGQHPPAAAVRMARKLLEHPSVDVVQGVRCGKQRGFLKNLASSFFYLVINRLMPEVRLTPGASDFRVIRKPVLELLKKYPDRHRNLRVLLASLKLPTLLMEYELAPRIAGATRYSLKKMLALAADGWFAFSLSPLRLSLLLMVASWLLVVAYLVYVGIVYLIGRTVPGWASLIALVIFMFSAVFGVLAIISEYVARIYADVRGHPAYVIRRQAQEPEREAK